MIIPLYKKILFIGLFIGLSGLILLNSFKWFTYFIILFIVYSYLKYGFVEMYIPSSHFEKPKRVVVSLTTLETRIENLQDTIQSILDNTMLPDRIYLNIHKDIDIPPELLKFLQEQKIIIIIPLEIDYGPVTKLYPTLLHETDPETIIITIDDDIIYHPNTIKHLLNASYNYPDTCICVSGWNYINLGLFHIPIINPSKNEVVKVSILQGYNGVLYKRKFFSDLAILEKNMNVKECKTTDDILISNSLTQSGINIYSIGMTETHENNVSKNIENTRLGSYNLQNFQWVKCMNKLENPDH